MFLFVLTLFNAASRPRRANVKIITDLRRDGCVFYLVREFYYFCGELYLICQPLRDYLVSIAFESSCIPDQTNFTYQVGRFLNIALSIPTDVRFSPFGQRYVTESQSRESTIPSLCRKLPSTRQYYDAYGLSADMLTGLSSHYRRFR